MKKRIVSFTAILLWMLVFPVFAVQVKFGNGSEHDLSALGVAVSDSPEGPFENVQILLKGGEPGYDATKLPNAIDLCVFFGTDGRLWMVYGNYSGGIFLMELDPGTGLIRVTASTCWAETTVALKRLIWYIVVKPVITTCFCPSAG